MNRTLTIFLIFVPVLIKGQVVDSTLKVDYNFKIKQYDDLIVVQNKFEKGIKVKIDTIYSCQFNSDNKIIAEYSNESTYPSSIVYSYDNKGRINYSIEYIAGVEDDKKFVTSIIKSNYNYNEIDSIKSIEMILCRRVFNDYFKKLIGTLNPVSVPMSKDYSNNWDCPDKLYGVTKFIYNEKGYRIFKDDSSDQSSEYNWYYAYNDNNKIIRETFIIKYLESNALDEIEQTHNESYYKYIDNCIERIDTLRMNSDFEYINYKYQLDDQERIAFYTETYKSLWGDKQVIYRRTYNYNYYPGTKKLKTIKVTAIDENTGKSELISEKVYHYK